MRGRATSANVLQLFTLKYTSAPTESCSFFQAKCLTETYFSANSGPSTSDKVDTLAFHSHPAISAYLAFIHTTGSTENVGTFTRLTEPFI
jgi:hypothetical protein